MKFTKTNILQIKGIAIVLMLFHHCFLNAERWATVPYEMLEKVKELEYYPISFVPFSSHTIQYLASFSKICVAMFVFMTGYGMYTDYKQKEEGMNIKNYVLNRWLSLMSGFLIIFFIIQLLSIFTGRYAQVYGNDWTSIFYFVLDGLGLGKLMGTPLFCLTWWYMSLAILLILLFPFLYKLIGEYKWIVLLGSIAIPRALGFTQTDLVRYSFAYILGMYFSEQNLLVTLKLKLLKGGAFFKIFKFIILTLGLAMIIKCRQNAWIGWKFLDFWDGFAAVYVIVFSYVYISDMKVINKVLEFLGKHSMNIFLIHSFFRDIFFHKFIYSFYYAWLDYLVLLFISLIASIALERFKKIIRYQVVVNNLRKLLIRDYK